MDPSKILQFRRFSCELMEHDVPLLVCPNRLKSTTYIMRAFSAAASASAA